MFMRLFILLPTLLLWACSHDGGFKLPGVYRIDIQQGSIIQQEMLSRLKPGMDKNQVKFIMGTPSIIDPFHAQRWEYLYTYSDGGRTRQQRHITLHFEDDKLVYVDGDVVPGATRVDELATRKTKTIDVPSGAYKERRGLARVIDALPFMGKDEDEAEPPEADAARAEKDDTDTDASAQSDTTAMTADNASDATAAAPTAADISAQTDAGTEQAE